MKIKLTDGSELDSASMPDIKAEVLEKVFELSQLLLKYDVPHLFVIDDPKQDLRISAHNANHNAHDWLKVMECLNDFLYYNSSYELRIRDKK